MVNDCKTMSAADAVGLIKNEDFVVAGHAAANPQILMRELVAQRDRYRGLRIFHVMPAGYGGYLTPEVASNFRHVTTFAGASSRGVVADGLADFIPCFFKDVPALLGEEIPVDVLLLNVAPPDQDGWCSLGVACDYTLRASQVARTIIAQVNDQMPRVGGRDNAVHISRLDAIVPCSDPLPSVPPASLTHEASEIARHCAAIVRDGDTLQLGIGAIPDAVLGALGDKNDLGIHSEIISDGVVDLVRAGVITGRRKTIHTDKIVATFLVGSSVLYDFVADNPSMLMLPVDYVNDPVVIARHDNMVSINSCLEVDLSGQVNAESVGTRQFSGVGGQVDFVRGARMSRGGRSIIAMPSTAARGTVSRIVPMLAPGGAVTTSRCDVDTIVTEWGAARMRGQTLRQRAENLIAIAHPDFRESLRTEFRRRFPRV